MFYDNYVRLCNSVHKSPSAVALEIGFKKSTVTRWKKGSNPTDATLQKIADYFDVAVNDLKGTEQKEKPALTEKDELDIKKKIDDLLFTMSHQKGLMFDGDPLTPEAIESIKNAMVLGMTAATLKNKEKYNPNKNKKESANGRDENSEKSD